MNLIRCSKQGSFFTSIFVGFLLAICFIVFAPTFALAISSDAAERPSCDDELRSQKTSELRERLQEAISGWESDELTTEGRGEKNAALVDLAAEYFDHAGVRYERVRLSGKAALEISSDTSKLGDHKINRFAYGLNHYSQTKLYFHPMSLVVGKDKLNVALYDPSINGVTMPFADALDLKVGTGTLHEAVHARFQREFRENRGHLLTGYSELKPKTYLSAEKVYSTGFSFDEIATFSYETRFTLSKLNLILEDKEDPALWEEYLTEARWVSEVGERLAKELAASAKKAKEKVTDFRHVSFYRESQYKKIWAKVTVDPFTKLFVPLTVPGLTSPKQLAEDSELKELAKKELRARFEKLETYCNELQTLLGEVRDELWNHLNDDGVNEFPMSLHKKTAKLAKLFKAGTLLAAQE